LGCADEKNGVVVNRRGDLGCESIDALLLLLLEASSLLLLPLEGLG
jgi:hypothetical protein